MSTAPGTGRKRCAPGQCKTTNVVPTSMVGRPMTNVGQATLALHFFRWASDARPTTGMSVPVSMLALLSVCRGWCRCLDDDGGGHVRMIRADVRVLTSLREYVRPRLTVGKIAGVEAVI